MAEEPYNEITEYIYIYMYIESGVRIVTVITVGNGLGYQSSNAFHRASIPLQKARMQQRAERAL